MCYLFHDGVPYHKETSPLICIDWFLYERDLRHDRVIALSNKIKKKSANRIFRSLIMDTEKVL